MFFDERFVVGSSDSEYFCVKLFSLLVHRFCANVFMVADAILREVTFTNVTGY